MACINEIVCLGNYCSCGDDVTINLTALHTGTYHMTAEFNGTFLSVKVPVVNGEKIVVPNIFNENYTHVISFTINSIPVYDTDFSIKMVVCNDMGEVSDEDNIIVLTAIAGSTITDPRLIGREVGGLIINDAAKNTGYEKTGATEGDKLASDTIQFNDGLTLAGGEEITILLL